MSVARIRLGQVLRVGVSVGLLALLVGRLGIAPILEAAVSAQPRWLLAALVTMLLSNIIGSYQWGRLLRLVGVDLPFRRIIGFYLVGIFFNNFFPSTIGGDVSRVVDAGRASGRRAAVLGVTLVDRLIGVLLVVGLAIAAALVLGNRLELEDGIRSMLVGIVALALVPIGGLGLLLSNRLSAGCARLAVRLPGTVGEKLLQLIDALAPLRAARHVALALLGVSLVIQVLRISTHVLVARALDIDLEVVYFFLFVPVLAALVMAPISINGIGVRESMGAVIFGTVGVDAAQASAMQFLAYIVAVAASLVGGIIFMLRRSTGPASTP